MLKYPFSVEYENSVYAYKVYKNAIGDVDVVNGTTDDYEIDVRFYGYVHILYNGALVAKIFVEDYDQDYIEWDTNYYYKDRSCNSCCLGQGYEESIAESLEIAFSNINSMIKSINDGKTVDGACYIEEIDADTWEQLIESLIENDMSIYIRLKDLYIKVKEDLLPSYKELMANGKIVFEDR